MRPHGLLLVVVLTFNSLGLLLEEPASAQSLQLRPGDHIAYIGNTMADRMQHSAWLETYIHALHPHHQLVMRNLGFPGDELTTRLREDNFGSPHEWLTKVEADVVFCFFGYNEALRGEGYLADFKKDLAATINDMRSRQYNGESAPQLVFFSPIAHEDLHNPNLPDGKENNLLLAKFTDAMREVCHQEKVRFVDLFSPTLAIYSTADQPLTINGIHLSDQGNQVVAELVRKELFSSQTLPTSQVDFTALRESILDKNYFWFSRYRVVDGYNVFGGRSKLAWFGQSNADVMMREMEIFDVMTANRDAKIWARAEGKDLLVVDDNLPAELEVKTNIPGKLPEGKHEYLGGREAIEKMKIAEGMQVNLFASEEMFPELINPVQMAVDTDGRLFASVWPSYPHWNPTQPRRDRIVCLPDDDGDGVADRCVVFADELNSVTGFEFWGGGMLVAALPEIWFLKDTDGDDKADVKIRMLQGVSSADSHHSANAMLVGPDGWLYWSRGIFNTASMETPTKTFRTGASGVHRFNPRTFEVEFHFPIGPNPHGDVFDQWGFQFANDGTSGTGSYVNIGKGIGNKQWFEKRVRPVAATGILSSSHFPEANQGNFLICNCIGFLGVLQHEVHYNGADITATEIEPILVSSDPNFRPTDVEVGGDGALYVSDWANAIVGHMQHNMRDPNRDHEHGRIYRVTVKDRPLLTPVKLKGKPISEVFKALLHPDNGVRYRARLELSGRETNEVIEQLSQWTDTLSAAKSDEAQALLESLWVREEHRVPSLELAGKAFSAEEPRVRAAAVRTVGHWADRVEGGEDLVLAAARDSSALVRAEAVKAAVAFDPSLAAEVVYEVAIRPLDPELETVVAYGRRESQADKRLNDAIAQNEPLSPAALEYALQFADINALAKLPKNAAVYEAILNRPNASTPLLREALDGLAQLRGESALPALVSMVAERDAASDSTGLSSLRELLLERPSAELRPLRAAIRKLAETGSLPETRQLGYAAWILADGKPDTALAAAMSRQSSLVDFLHAVPDLASSSLSDQLYDAVRPLMFDLPSELVGSQQGGGLVESGIAVDYFYPNPPNVAIETLEKLLPTASGIVPTIRMDVPQREKTDQFALRFTGGLLVPQTGTYEFFIASDDGSRIYVDGRLLVDNDRLQGMTERSNKIDLNAGSHSLTVTYFDNGGGDGLQVNWRGPGFDKQPIPAEALIVNSQQEGPRDLAVRAVSAINGHHSEKFSDWSRLVSTNQSRAVAIEALKSLPASSWDDKQIPSLIDNIVAYLSSIPAKYRTAGPAVEAVELTKALADRLDTQPKQAVLDRLQNLDVRIIAIGTVVERMIYDKEKIVVQAGKPVEFRFSNIDNMPHNFVVLQPGALEEVGLLAEATALEADAKERNYVPRSSKILLSSKLLDPGKSQTLTFDAPTEPGMYPYVCTYPGHWRRMFGVLVVVADLDEYTQAPDQYMAANPLPTKDPLLETIGRDVDWQFSDLAGELKQLRKGRSFEVGRNLFRVASCVGCHKLGDEGREFGPDLAKLDEKKSDPAYILRSILEPSAEIDKKYQSQLFVTDTGEVIKGMVVAEDDASVSVLVDPLAKADPIKLAKDEIEERQSVEVSAMPQGLLSKLSPEEILDLMAYVVAKGNPKDKLYMDEGHHHNH